MKGGILFTGSGPIAIVTSYGGFTNPHFVEKLNAKGVRQFLAFEVPVEELQEKYGNHFNVIMHDLRQTDDLRVLDEDGDRVLGNFKLSGLGEPVIH